SGSDSSIDALTPSSTMAASEPSPKPASTQQYQEGEEIKKRRTKRAPEVKAPGAHALLMAEYSRLFKEKVGTPPVIVGGRDGKILADLLRQHEEDVVQRLLQGFFRVGTRWNRENGCYDLPAFKHVFNDLQVMDSRGEL